MSLSAVSLSAVSLSAVSLSAVSLNAVSLNAVRCGSEGWCGFRESCLGRESCLSVVRSDNFGFPDRFTNNAVAKFDFHLAPRANQPLRLNRHQRRAAMATGTPHRQISLG